MSERQSSDDRLEELRARIAALAEARDRLLLDQARAAEKEKEELEPIIQALHEGVRELTEELDRRKEGEREPGPASTRRESAEEVEAWNRDLVRALLETHPAAVVQVDAEGRIVLANGEALRLLELSFEAASGEVHGDWESRILREDGVPCPADENPLRCCLRTGDAQPPALFRIRRADATDVLAVFRATPLWDSERNVRGAVMSALETPGP